MARSLILVLCLLGTCLYLHPVQVKTVTLSTYADFQQGLTFNGVQVTSNGFIEIGTKTAALEGPKSEFYLSMDVSVTGDFYIGTGHSGSIYKINFNAPTDKRIEEIFQSDYLDIYAILTKKNGEIIFAASPNGKVFKLNKEKKVEEIFAPEEKIIWEMKEDKEGNIICAVGNSGAVYKITSSGDTINIFSGEDSHIISLFITSNGKIMAGSGDRGILYEIDNRKSKVLFQTPFDEIRGICEDKSGNIYFAASQTTSGSINQKIPNLEKLFEKEEEKKTATLKETSAIYCLKTDGSVEKVWSLDTEYIYCLGIDRQNGDVLIGTGNRGRLYRLKADDTYSIAYEGESAQIYKIIDKNGLYLLTNNTAGLIKIEDELNTTGTYISKIFNLESMGQLGRLYWEADTKNPLDVTFAIRYGNSNTPDKTWSEWSAPFNNPQNAIINSNKCSFFQIKAVLNTANIAYTPRVKSIKVFYLPVNLKPRINNITVADQSLKPENNKKSDEKTPIPAAHLLISWKAEDPNKDQLKFSLFLKKETEKIWTLLKKDLQKPELLLDQQMFENGIYELKIEADDALDNPPDMALKNTLISSPFIIDSTSPVVQNMVYKDKILSFEVVDENSIISQVLFAFDRENWYPVFPQDLINDAKQEKYLLNLSQFINERKIFIKVTDEKNNSKVFQKELQESK